MIVQWSRNGDQDERSDHDANHDQQELGRILPLAMWHWPGFVNGDNRRHWRKKIPNPTGLKRKDCENQV